MKNIEEHPDPDAVHDGGWEGTPVPLGSFSNAVLLFQKEPPQQKVYPPESPVNSVTVLLLCLWLMVLFYGNRMQNRSVRFMSPG